MRGNRLSIGIQKGPHLPTLSAGCRVIVVAALEPSAVIAGFDDIAVVGQAIEQRGGHFGIGEYARPFTEGEVVMNMTEVRS